MVQVSSTESCTLKEAVDRALAGYFSDLGESAPSNLYDLVLREVERPLLELTLAHCQGNQSRAAEALGIHRGTLRKKLREHDLV
ncbi:MAG: helix-turn-helix domain-containing protein [Thioalkalivibrionaceae bacterium]